MLTELCGVLRNWFETDRISGTYTVENGSITLPCLQNGQFFRVVGSVFNDGVHQYPDYAMADETFDGSIWPMAVPSAVLALEAEIRAWQEKNGDAAASPFTSESFGGYSYSKGSSGSTSASGAVTWQMTFKSRMNQWRKI
jgi:hypothetical protein